MRKKLSQHIKFNSRLKLAKSLNQRGRKLIKRIGIRHR